MRGEFPYPRRCIVKRMWWQRLVCRKSQPAAQRRRKRSLWCEQLEARCQPSVTGVSPIDQIGNNVADPSLGTANTNLLRLSPAAYKPVANGGDGLNTPSMTYGAPDFV